MTIRTVLTALLLALMATTQITARAADQATQSGNIIDDRITSAQINPRTSIATISGAIQCSTPTPLRLYAWAQQYHSSGGRAAQYYRGAQVVCSPTPTTYTVTITPGYQSDRLVPGPASLGFWAEYRTPSYCYGFNTESDMRLVPRQ